MSEKMCAKCLGIIADGVKWAEFSMDYGNRKVVHYVCHSCYHKYIDPTNRKKSIEPDIDKFKSEIPDATNRVEAGGEYTDKHYSGLMKRLADTPPPEPENLTVTRELLKVSKWLLQIYSDCRDADASWKRTGEKRIAWAESQLANVGPKVQCDPVLVNELVTLTENLCEIPYIMDPGCGANCSECGGRDKHTDSCIVQRTLDVITKLRESEPETKILEFEIDTNQATYRLYMIIPNDLFNSGRYFMFHGMTYKYSVIKANAIAESLGFTAKVVEK